MAVEIDGRRRVWVCARDGEYTRVGIGGRAWAFRDEPLAPRRELRERGAALEAPMPGSVLDVRVAAGDSVRAGDVLVVLESMKMELEVVAPEAGIVERLSVVTGDRVTGGQVLVAIGKAA
jgi:biotin carboxyl carrier protein